MTGRDILSQEKILTLWALIFLCLNTLMYQHCLGQDVIGAGEADQCVATDFAEVVTVVVDGTAVLPCAKPPNGSHTVVWIGRKSELLAVDDKLTQERRQIRVVKESTDVSTLRIEDVKFEDQGIYKCQIISERPIVKQIFLVVQIPPQIHRQGTESHISVYQGGICFLLCTASGVPPPTVLWYKISGETRTALKKDGEVYNIISMSENDAGIYECVASNGVRRNDSMQYTVDYIPYPSFVDPGTDTIIVNEGQTAVLPCFVQNLGEFEVRWYKGINLLTMGTYAALRRHSIKLLSSNDFSLQINTTNPNDAGEYSCRICDLSRDEWQEKKYVNLEVKENPVDPNK